ncbi:hypothetical protein [Frankia sp. Cj3]|uniref:hypothetical protein n=1 Tax=Frankia sp. Cj3 TaxID=2880976 RepID=UPI001EF44642|nr:hypothetical protein [Frankia sp. Cj3]
MSLLTEYSFQDRYWYGPFEQFNQLFPDGGWAWISRGGPSAAALAWVRQDDEQVLDFALIVANPIVTNAVKSILNGTEASLTSGLTAQGMFWKDVPYSAGDAGRHQPWDMLVRVYFNVHIHTPWYCTDADATVSYYLVFWLDDTGHLHGSADYAAWTFSGGWPFCEGGVNDALRAAISGGFSTVQQVLDEAIPLVTRGTYRMLYFLPGNGTRIGGDSTQDADRDVALALLPKED